MSKPALRILIADDHPLVLAGFAALIGSRDEFSIVGECTDGEDALNLIEEMRPDIAVLDYRMPGRSGLEILNAMQAGAIDARGILISASLNAEDVARAVAAGAQGVIRKDAAPEELIACLLHVGAGGNWLPAAETGHAECDQAANVSLLTTREKDVADLASGGMTNKEIARKLGLSEGTIKIHLYNIFRKVGSKNRTELANQFRGRSQSFDARPDRSP